MYALVDCNNFFVSCERVFRPELNKRPVIVLSSNDGCAVARSNEAKALGIKMGEPLFKMKELVERHRVECISGNLAFYGDMSRRVMSVLKDLAPSIEVYSIDEAFLDLSGISADQLKPLCLQICETVEKWTGIPVSIGIAPTKTLAKAAALVAKKYPETNGVYDISSYKAQRAVLQRMDVNDVWGIGAKLTEKLKGIGIHSAWHLREMNDVHLRKLTNVITQKTLLELQGTPCLGMNEGPEYKKQIISSRSFGQSVTTLKGMQEAVATFVDIAAKKLRDDGSIAKQITVYIRTNRFKADHYSNAHMVMLSMPTAHTGRLTQAAMEALTEIYKPNMEFKKASVYLGGIIPAGSYQPNLFEVDDTEEQNKIMEAFDKINAKMGKHTLRYASANPRGAWHSLSRLSSPYYTGRWDELLKVT